jgi:hypothetical protein
LQRNEHLPSNKVWKRAFEKEGNWFIFELPWKEVFRTCGKKFSKQKQGLAQQQEIERLKLLVAIKVRKELESDRLECSREVEGFTALPKQEAWKKRVRSSSFGVGGFNYRELRNQGRKAQRLELNVVVAA